MSIKETTSRHATSDALTDRPFKPGMAFGSRRWSDHLMLTDKVEDTFVGSRPLVVVSFTWPNFIVMGVSMSLAALRYWVDGFFRNFLAASTLVHVKSASSMVHTPC